MRKEGNQGKIKGELHNQGHVGETLTMEEVCSLSPVDISILLELKGAGKGESTGQALRDSP